MATPDITELYRRHRDFVGRSLGHFGVPDVDRPDQIHEVFIVVHRQLPSYRGDASLRTWLFAIVRRIAASYRRRSYRVYEHVTDSIELGSSGAEVVEEAAERSLARRRLGVILGKMHSSQRKTLLMVEVNGLSRKRIAELTGCRPQTVASRLYRARQMIRREAHRADTAAKTRRQIRA